MSLEVKGIHARAVGALVLVSVLALAVVAGGCSSAKTAATGQKVDRKALTEAAARYYVALGAQDLPALRALVDDPTDILGLASATPPGADAQTSTVRWVWQGDRIVVSSDSDESTYTLSSTDTSPNVVQLKDAKGTTLDTVVMKLTKGAWRVDAQETQKASQAQVDSPEGQKQTCWQNQSNIESAASSYNETNGKFPKTMADLVPDFFDTPPTCPTTGAGYTLGPKGVVAPCKVHGHYPAQETP